MKKKILNELNEDFGILDEIVKDTPKQNLHFIDRVSELTEQIWKLLEDKGWKQVDLAKAMGKSESEISKILSGSHNLTMRTIAHVETVLEENIFYTNVGKELKNKRENRREYCLYANFNNSQGNASGAIDSHIPSGNGYLPAKAS